MYIYKQPILDKNKSEINTFEKIDEYMKFCLKKWKVFVSKEDHNFFSKNILKIEETLSGKLLLLNTNEIDNHHIFFDDNIGHDESYIVDVWDIGKKNRLPFNLTKDVFLSKVNLVYAICDSQYFIQKLVSCLKNRANLLGMELNSVYFND